MSFNTKEIPIEVHKIKKTTLKEPYKIIITKDLTDTDFKNIINEGIKKGVSLNFKKIKRNANNEIIRISAKFKNKKDSGTHNLDGTDPIKPFSYRQSKEELGFYTEWETLFVKGKPFSDIKVEGYEEEKDSTKTKFMVKPFSTK